MWIFRFLLYTVRWSHRLHLKHFSALRFLVRLLRCVFLFVWWTLWAHWDILTSILTFVLVSWAFFEPFSAMLVVDFATFDILNVKNQYNGIVPSRNLISTFLPPSLSHSFFSHVSRGEGVQVLFLLEKSKDFVEKGGGEGSSWRILKSTMVLFLLSFSQGVGGWWIWKISKSQHIFHQKSTCTHPKKSKNGHSYKNSMFFG